MSNLPTTGFIPAPVFIKPEEKFSVLKNTEKPAVSCYCSTYGRPTRLLESSIQCFLNQDYDGPKELVILNDFNQQELVFDHPEVRIINHPERIKPLGRKFNENIKLCKYDILACWEDDDIFLPNRLSYSIANMRNGIFHTHHAFFEQAEKSFIKSQNIFHSTHVFTRELFNQVGGYPEIDQCSVDISIMDRFRQAVGNYTQDINDTKDYVYCYVWGGAQSYHGSGWGASNTNVSDSATDIVQMQIGQGHVRTGVINLEPKLRYNFYDYLPRD